MAGNAGARPSLPPTLRDFPDGRGSTDTARSGFIHFRRAHDATKALAISMAGAAALALAVLITLDEPPGAPDLPPAIRIDEARRMPLPRTEGGRIPRDLSRQTFRFPWPLVEDKATLTCRPGSIATVIASSGEYGLSGRAIAAGYPSIWDSVLPIELRRDAALAPLVQAALALCPDTEDRQTSPEMGQRHGRWATWQKPALAIDRLESGTR